VQLACTFYFVIYMAYLDLSFQGLNIHLVFSKRKLNIRRKSLFTLRKFPFWIRSRRRTLLQKQLIHQLTLFLWISNVILLKQKAKLKYYVGLRLSDPKTRSFHTMREGPSPMIHFNMKIAAKDLLHESFSWFKFRFLQRKWTMFGLIRRRMFY
jgi:hypothetical protein